jgi:phage I-like protein
VNVALDMRNAFCLASTNARHHAPSVRLSRVLCSATLEPSDEALPSEFLLFKGGVTETTKGKFTVDAERVVQAWRNYGVRLILDSEHASLDDEVFKARGDARDALAYFDLEARADGSIWAVNVKFTDVGAERLRSRKAVYVSPAFVAEEGRVVEIINAALTSMPATHNAVPLVAASRGGTDKKEQAMRLARVALLSLAKKRGASGQRKSHHKGKASSARR